MRVATAKWKRHRCQAPDHSPQAYHGNLTWAHDDTKYTDPTILHASGKSHAVVSWSICRLINIPERLPPWQPRSPEASRLWNPLAIYRGLSGRPSPKPRKSLQKVSRGLQPQPPSRESGKVWKKSQESGKSLEKVPKRLCRDFFRLFRLFRCSRAGRARETLVNGQRGPKSRRGLGPKTDMARLRDSVLRCEEGRPHDIRLEMRDRQMLVSYVWNFWHPQQQCEVASDQIVAIWTLSLTTVHKYFSVEWAHRYHYRMQTKFVQSSISELIAITDVSRLVHFKLCKQSQARWWLL